MQKICLCDLLPGVICLPSALGLQNAEGVLVPSFISSELEFAKCLYICMTFCLE